MKHITYPLIAGAMLWSGQCLAADLEPVEPESDWTFAVAPYFWAAGLDGTVGQFGLPNVDVNAKFSDILENLDFAAMGVAEAHNGTIGVFSDFMYVKVSADKGLSAGPLNVNIDLSSETLSFLLAGELRLVDADAGSLDFLAGARLWSVDTDVDISGVINISGSDGDTWIDPIVGFKGRANLSPDFYLTGWGMIGGFGISSDLTWDVLGGVGYSVSDSISLVAGYRAISVDYHEDNFKFDIIEHGPILGAVITF
jgi:hypothetical protein